jgi:hypothetical protein
VPRFVLIVILLAMSAASASAQAMPGPVLGGPVAPFTQVLGGPNEASIGALLHFKRCAGTQIDEYVLLAPNDRVWTIQRAWCERTNVPTDQRFADAVQFLPADAVAGTAFITNQGEAAVTYTSASLASELPAGLFHDCTGNSVPAGTLFIVADSFGGWYMGPGTCPGG